MNFFSDEIRRDPFVLYEQMRGRSPLLHLPALKLWMIFDYEGVKRALTDHETFSSSMPVAGRAAPEWLVFFDPPRHSKLRALILRAFTPGVVAGLGPRIRELSHELLDQWIERGAMDLAADFSVPLPTMVIAEMIGIPIADWPRFKRWSDVILKLSLTVSGTEHMPEVTAEFREITAEMSGYLAALIGQRKAEPPRDDLLTRLVDAEVDGERLSHAEILAFIQLLLVAGQETTANLINNAILCLLENPDQFARLKAAPDLLPTAIEEVLRYRSPLQWTLRATRREAALHGHTIPAGELVLAVMGSANRDTSQFPDAGRFDIGRDPNPHIAFGHGIHFCLGAALSRLESRVALTTLMERVTGLERASAEPWQPRQALHVHGPASLPIRFQPKRRGAGA